MSRLPPDREPVDLIEIEWYSPDEGDPAASAERLLQVLRDEFPEALPQGFRHILKGGRYSKFIWDDRATLCAAVAEGAVQWTAHVPVTGGDVVVTRGRFALFKPSLTVTAGAWSSAGHDRLLAAVASIGDALGAFYASGVLLRRVIVDGAEYYAGLSSDAPRNKVMDQYGWLGLPWRNVVFEWFGAPYAPLVSSLPAEVTVPTPSGLLARWADQDQRLATLPAGLLTASFEDGGVAKIAPEGLRSSPREVEAAAAEMAAARAVRRGRPARSDAAKRARVTAGAGQPPASSVAARSLTEVLLRHSVSSDDVVPALDWGDGTAVTRIALPSARAASKLARDLRVAYPQTGVWPLLVEPGVGEDVASIASAADACVVGQSAVMESLNIDAARLLDENGLEAPIALHQSNDDVLAALASYASDRWAGLTMGGEWAKCSTVLLVACAQPWEALARVGFGGWNDCPSPAAQAAFQRHFTATLGMEVHGVGRDLVLTYLKSPPTDPQLVLSAVRDLINYCSELDDLDSIDVAHSLLGGPAFWSFWWD